MWLCNKLFGWEYASVSFVTYSYIRRIRTAPNGGKFVLVYGEVVKMGMQNWYQVK